jgi:hypothetical protein
MVLEMARIRKNGEPSFIGLITGNHREAFVLQGWILEILRCDSKESKAFLRIFFTTSTEGSGVCV